MRWLICLICAILVCIPSGGIAQSKHKPKQHKNVGQLRSDLNKLRKKKAALRAELKTTRRAATAVLADIHVVDGQLSDLEGKLQETGDRLGESKSQQQVVAAELSDATKKLAETKEQVRTRIRRMYKQGDTNVLTAMVGTGDVGEIASRQYVMERIAGQDKKVFLNYLALREKVKAKKEQADELVHRVASLLATQQEEQQSLQGARVKKGQYLKELQAKQGELQEMLSQFEQDEHSITAEIQAYQRRQRGPTRHGHKPEPEERSRSRSCA